MTEFGAWKLPSNLSPSPTSFGPLIASGKQRGVRGGWASGDGSLPRLMQINDRKQTGGRVRVGEKETSDMAFSSIQNLIINLTPYP